MLNINDFINYLPEFIILFAVFIQIIFKFFEKKLLKNISNFCTLISLSLSLGYFIVYPVIPDELFCQFFKILVLLSSIIVILFPAKRIIIKDIISFNILFLGLVFFILMIINAKDFFSLYVNIELFSIVLYFILSFDMNKLSYAEAVKYLLSSVIASSFLLLGLVFIYGLTGTLIFEDSFIFLVNNSDKYSLSTYMMPFLFIISGVFFKLGVFPFGRWMIDIFRSIDTKIVAFVSVVPKLGILASLIKIFKIFNFFETSYIVVLFAIFTALFGSYYGLRENNFKVIMSLSAYVNISYILIGLAFYTKVSLAAIMFYCFTYIFMNLGAFLCIQALESSNYSNNNCDFKGYFYDNPIFSSCFLVCIISLLGLPLTSGFIAKVYLFLSILSSGIIAFPIVLCLFFIMVLSTVFYLNIIKKMFLQQSTSYKKIMSNQRNNLLLYFCTLITLVLGVSPTYLIKICEGIAGFI